MCKDQHHHEHYAGRNEKHFGHEHEQYVTDHTKHYDEHAKDHVHISDRHAKKIVIQEDVLSDNQSHAERNRGWFDAKIIKCVNIVSSPGSGKANILEETIKALKDSNKIFVIEGDQHTTNDADRISATGVDAIQINTENGCHLDANMVKVAVDKLNVPESSLLFIENVGNLVCPAMFDLGEDIRVVVISVTEGDDKPVKYPYMFQSSNVCLINKIDLLPHLKSDIELIKANALKINPKLKFFALSAITGEGMKDWIDFIKV